MSGSPVFADRLATCQLLLIQPLRLSAATKPSLSHGTQLMAAWHPVIMLSLKGCVCMRLGRPDQSAVSCVRFTWQSIASKSLALSLKAMISVGHTNVNACRQDKRTACQQATDNHCQVVQGEGGAGAYRCWCCGGGQL